MRSLEELLAEARAVNAQRTPEERVALRTKFEKKPEILYASFTPTNATYLQRQQFLQIAGERICETGSKCTKAGWSFDPNTGYWVCGYCRRPSLYSAVWSCGSCLSPFFLDKAPVKDEDILCKECS